MLGTLAKWLRIYGFDTFYASAEITDEELIKISKKENRVFVTRDKKLVHQARRENIHVIQITSTNIDEQLGKILSDVKMDRNIILSRCLICNSVVDDISKKNVEDKVPKRVFENNEEFWYCPRCDKIYWRGSHYEKMIEKINQIKKD
jgi:uncharacterized protein with PIN domain